MPVNEQALYNAAVNAQQAPGYTKLAGSNLAAPKGPNGASVGAGLAGELINVGANLYTQWRNREFQREMLAGEQDFTREMWNANNAYNTPLSQVNRLKLAGLNPSLMYGSMSDAGNSTLAGSPGGAAPNQVAPHVDPLLMASIDKLHAETEAIEHETKREDEKQPVTMEQLRTEITSLGQQIQQGQQQIKNMKAEEQIFMMDYLLKSDQYNRSLATFKTSLRGLIEDVNSKVLNNRFSQLQIDEAAATLPYRLLGLDLSNKHLQSQIGLNWQAYRQSDELFGFVKAIKRIEANDAVTKAKTNLLQYFINAYDNPNSYRYFLNSDESGLFGFSYDGKGEYPLYGRLEGFDGLDNFMLPLIDDAARLFGAVGNLLGGLKK